MKKLLIAIAAVMITAATYGQGQVIFNNRVGAVGLDAPVTVAGSNPLKGPGSSFSAQLYLSVGGALTPLTPIVTFRDVASGATGNAALADRYFSTGPAVDVPGVAPGATASFVVRAWQTSLGTYDTATAARGQSEIFTATVGGGTLPPTNLGDATTGLKGFAVTIVPEPSVIVLGVLGASALLLRRRK